MKIFRWNFNPIPSCLVDPSLRKSSIGKPNLWDKAVVRVWHFFCYWPWQHIQHKLLFRKTRRLEKELGYNQEGD